MEGTAIVAQRLRVWLFPSLAGPWLLGFCVGVGLLQWQAELPSAFELSAGMMLLLVLSLSCKGLAQVTSLPVKSVLRGLSRLLSVAFAVVLGFTWAAWRAEYRLADELPMAWERRDIRVVGVISELPREYERGRRFVFSVEQVETPDARVPKRILLSWFPGAHEDQWLEDRVLLPGERWRFTVRLKRPHGHVNPGGFDYEGWLLERGLRATGYVRAQPGAERLGEVWTPATLVERVRARLRQHLQKNLPDATFGGVVIALALGDQGSIASEHWRIFSATGVTHLMSISGLHITMMAALLGGLMNWVWRRYPRGMLWIPAQRMAVVSGWIAAFAYTLLAGAGIPAVRTLLMLSVVALAHSLDRQVAAARILLLALFFVLLVDPWAVLVVGFWLSFAAVGVLLFFAREASPARDVQQAESRWARGVSIVRQWGWTQWVVTLGTLPLVLLLFQTFSLASPIANALAIPLVGFVIAPLSVAAAILPFPWISDVTHTILSWLMMPLEGLSLQPWALWRQAEPAFWAVTLSVIGILLHLFLKSWRYKLAALGLVAPLLMQTPERPRPGDIWLDLFDVGQGLSALVRTEEYNLLFDAGPRFGAETTAGDRLVLPALRALGVNHLDGMVISHQDQDHSGGAAAVMAEMPATWLAGGLLPEQWSRFALAGQSPIACRRGQQFEWKSKQ